ALLHAIRMWCVVREGRCRKNPPYNHAASAPFPELPSFRSVALQAFPVHRRNFVRQNDIAFGNKQLENTRKNRSDTVGQPPRAAIWVSKMPSLKAKKLRILPQEKVLFEL